MTEHRQLSERDSRKGHNMTRQDEAIKLLKDIRHISHIIEVAEEEISRLYTALTSTTIKAKEVDVQTSINLDPLGDKMAKIIEYQEKIKEYYTDLMTKKGIALDVLKQMGTEEQEILLLRYFKGLTVEGTAEELDMSYYGAWKKLNRVEEQFCEIYAKNNPS